MDWAEDKDEAPLTVPSSSESLSLSARMAANALLLAEDFDDEFV
ncbi:MAG: hypothetical protein AAGU74_04230 [Bacillota bacterium]